MSFFDGLYPYEVVLLWLGALFFLILAAAFVRLVWMGKPYGKLLPFFVVPVAMIGWPGIQSVQYQNGVIEIQKTTTQLQQDPTNAALRATLQAKLAQAVNRPATAPQASAILAAAQFALGDHKSARAGLAKALEQAPQLAEALNLKKRIDLDDRLNTLTAQVERDLNNAAAKKELASTADEVAGLHVASPVLLSKAARAQKLVGNAAAAERLDAQVAQIHSEAAK